MIQNPDQPFPLIESNDRGAEQVPGEPIAPDLEEAERFLTLLDAEAAAFTFQVFDDDLERKDQRMAATRNGSLLDCQNELIKAQESGAGVFVTVQETDLKGRNTGNIQRIRAVFQEDDGMGVEPPIEPHSRP